MSEKLDEAARIIEEMGDAAERAARVTKEAYPDIAEKWTLDAKRSRELAAAVRGAAALTARVAELEAALERLIYLTAPDNSPMGECIICGPMYVDGRYSGHDDGCAWEAARAALAGKEKPSPPAQDAEEAARTAWDAANEFEADPVAVIADALTRYAAEKVASEKATA